MDNLKDQNANQLLELYLSAEDETEAENLLGDLFQKHAVPICRALFRARVGQSAVDEKDAEDFTGEVRFKLLKLLKRKKEFPGERKINSFGAYLKTICRNVFADFWRERSPEIFLLQSKLRYLLEKPDAGFAYWRGDDGQFRCGWHDQTANRSTAASEKIIERVKTSRPTYIQDALPDLAAEIFRQAGGWLGFRELCGITADLQGIKNLPWLSFVADGELIETKDFSSGDEHAEESSELKIVWHEIRELPRFQRLALLYSMRDDGGEAVSRFLETNLATTVELAGALEIEEDELEKTLAELPFSDNRIAEISGIEEVRKVANLRKVAREYLARRIAGKEKRRRQK